MSVTVPLSAVSKGAWINLRNDQFADPNDADEAFAEPVYVWLARRGAPTSQDRLRVYDVKLFGTPRPEDEEDTGCTFIVSPGDGANATLVYFPDDQHEITVVERDTPIEND